jgi:hypothetical protein
LGCEWRQARAAGLAVTAFGAPGQVTTSQADRSAGRRDLGSAVVTMTGMPPPVAGRPKEQVLLHVTRRDTDMNPPETTTMPADLPSGSKLYGLRTECQALDRVIAGLRTCQSRVLIVRGEAGPARGCSWITWPSGRQARDAGPERSFPGGPGTCACRGARVSCGGRVREYLGSGEFFVHPGAQNPPASQNTPR